MENTTKQTSRMAQAETSTPTAPLAPPKTAKPTVVIDAAPTVAPKDGFFTITLHAVGNKLNNGTDFATRNYDIIGGIILAAIVAAIFARRAFA